MKFPARKVAPAAVDCHAIVDHHPSAPVSFLQIGLEGSDRRTANVTQRLLISRREFGDPMVLSAVDWGSDFCQRISQ